MGEEIGEMAVVARDIVKKFGSRKALDSLTVEIPRGITYCILGPNGSGKTTFIRSIVGLLRLDGGELKVLGEPVSRVHEIYSKIGYMTQHKALYPDLTLQENLEFFAGLYSIYGNICDRRISDLLEMVDLMDYRHSLAGTLSGGMYQRLSLACTLIHEPELLLLDEPTVGVDPRLRQTFWDYFDSLSSNGKTVLITTHLMDEAERCMAVGYMRGGRMAAAGSPDEIKRIAGLKPRLDLWLNELQKDAARLRELGYAVEIEGDVVQVAVESREQIRDILEEVKPLDMRLREPKLEDAFIKLSEAG